MAIDGAILGKPQDEGEAKQMLRHLSGNTHTVYSGVCITDGTKETVPLSEIATVTETETLASITRSEQRRYLSVSATVADGYNVTLVSDEARQALADLKLPAGCKIEYAGENETIMSAMRDLLEMLLLGILIIYLIMVAQFQSLLSPFIVILTVPLSFAGGFLGLLIAGYEVSIVAMIGMIMLVGIVVNNGIVLVDCANRLREEEGLTKREAIVDDADPPGADDGAHNDPRSAAACDRAGNRRGDHSARRDRVHRRPDVCYADDRVYRARAVRPFAAR